MSEAGMYSVFEDNIHLESSFMVRKEDFEMELNVIRERYPEIHLWKIFIEPLKQDWAAHNCLYLICIVRERTGYME